MYCLDVHSLKDTRYSPKEGFGYSKKLGIEKANLRQVKGRTEVWGLIYSTNLPTHMTFDIQTQKGRHSPHNEVYY